MEANLLPLMMPAMPLALPSSSSRLHDPRVIDSVATGFESMFLSQMLKEMRQTLEPETMFGSDAGDVLGGLFDHFLGQHMAQSGAVGIGAMVKKQLTELANTAPPASS